MIASNIQALSQTITNKDDNKVCGLLFMVNTDGCLGKRYDIISDVVIGRKSCDIVLESKAISRQHCKILVDENSNCVLENLSLTNPTQLNAEKVCGAVSLQNKDRITVGDIKLVYLTPDEEKTSKIDTVTVDKVRKPELPPLDDIVQKAKQLNIRYTSLELSHSQNVQKKTSSMSTPLKKAIAARRKIFDEAPQQLTYQSSYLQFPDDAVSIKLSSVDRPKKLSTPIKAAILGHRRSRDASDGGNSSTVNQQLPKRQIHLSTPIKAAIHKRRLSFNSNPPIDRSKEAVVESSYSVESSEDTEEKSRIKSIMSDFINAIQARSRLHAISSTPVRPTVASVSIPDYYSIQTATGGDYLIPSASAPASPRLLSGVALSHPISASLHQRPYRPMPTVVESPLEKEDERDDGGEKVPTHVVESTMDTRKSTAETVVDRKDETFVDSVEQESNDTVVDIAAKELVTQRTAPAELVVPAVNQQWCTQVSTRLRAINAKTKQRFPYRNFSKPLSMLYQANSDYRPLKPISRVTKMVEGKLHEDLLNQFNSVVDYANAKIDSNGDLNAASANARHTDIDQDRHEAQLAAFVSVTCAQLAVDAFAIELELQQTVPAAQAYDESITAFLEEPKAFMLPCDSNYTPSKSLSTVNINSDDDKYCEATHYMENVHRESILEILVTTGRKSETVACELIGAMTHAELNLVEAYSDQLANAGVPKEEATEMAFNSFTQGVSTYHEYSRRRSLDTHLYAKGHVRFDEDGNILHRHMRWNEEGQLLPPKTPLRVQLPGNSTDDEVAMELDSENCGINNCEYSVANQEEEISYFGASLRNLFSVGLAGRYDESESEMDARLVLDYANEMSACGGIDPNVAYGIALDVFLDDPVAFRVHVNKMSGILAPVRSVLNTFEVCTTASNDAVTDTKAAIPDVEPEAEPQQAVDAYENYAMALETETASEPVESPQPLVISAERSPVNSPSLSVTAIAPVSMLQVELATLDENDPTYVQAFELSVSSSFDELKKQLSNSLKIVPQSVPAIAGESFAPFTPSGKNRRLHNTPATIITALPFPESVSTPISPRATRSGAIKAAHTPISSATVSCRASPRFSRSTSAASGSDAIRDIGSPRASPRVLRSAQKSTGTIFSTLATASRKQLEELETVGEGSVVCASVEATANTQVNFDANLSKLDEQPSAEIDCEASCVSPLIPPVHEVPDAVRETDQVAAESLRDITEQYSMEVDNSVIRVNFVEACAIAAPDVTATVQPETPAQLVIISPGPEFFQSETDMISSGVTCGSSVTAKLESEQVHESNTASVLKKEGVIDQHAPTTAVYTSAVKTKLLCGQQGGGTVDEAFDSNIPTFAIEGMAPSVTRSSRKRSPTPVIVSTTPKSAAKKNRGSAKAIKADNLQELIEEDDDEEIVVLILCDGCDGEFTLDDAKLFEVPEGDWFCTKCTKKMYKRGPVSADSVIKQRGSKRRVATVTVESNTDSRPLSKRSRSQPTDTGTLDNEVASSNSSRRTTRKT